MNQAKAATGTVVFFAVAPGVVAGLVPWLLTRWDVGPDIPIWVRLAGGLLAALGVITLILTFIRFVAEGGGTPAPVAPTERLVVGGLYRYVRNPMYLAVVATILGQGLLLGRPVLLLYGALVWSVVALFVRLYEEPVLRGQFGVEYETYRRCVPGWLPRLKPWQPDNDI
jgi:protein-S-isoprenylcysteine O-methyltransferase Ste14